MNLSKPLPRWGMYPLFFLLMFYCLSPQGYAQRRYDGRQKLSHVAAGVSSSYEIINGTLWAWGRNGNGQLGDGTTTDRYAPVQIGSDNTWIHVAAGYFCAYGLKADGSLWAWGYNYWGQLGLGNTIQQNTPQHVGTDTWTYLAANEYAGHVLAIKEDGSLWGWGSNGVGQLATGSASSVTSPISLSVSGQWNSVAVGGSSSIAIRSDGTLWGWGAGQSGEFGTGDQSVAGIINPMQIGTDKWISVTVQMDEVGYSTPSNGNNNAYWSNQTRSSVLAIKADGTLWGWGFNDENVLGVDMSSCLYCYPHQLGSDRWIAVTQTELKRCMGIKADGTLWGWGMNDFDPYSDYSASIAQVGTDKTWTELEGGGFHMIALKADGTTYTWGSNNEGQIGNNTASSTIIQQTPLSINLGVSLDSWRVLVSGEFHSVGIKSNGTLWAWGYNVYGQLGDGTTVDKNCPVQIGSDNDWVSVSAGFGHTLAIKSNGTLWAWGYNAYGQLGNNSTTNQSTPQQISTEAWVSISAGYEHNVAIKGDGSLYTWGLNGNGQLGDNSTTQRNVPTLIGLDVWVTASAGKLHTTGINGGHDLYTWGYNNNGILGNGGTTEQHTPQLIGTDKWISISASSLHTCAIRSDGNLLAWGYGSSGRLGTGNTSNQSSPVVVGSTSDHWRTCSASTFSSTMGIRTNGALYGWGINSYGQLGDGGITQQLSPERIGTDNNWWIIAGGRYHYIGTKADRLYFFASGDNGYGQLGLSVTSTKVFLNNAGATYATVPTNATPYSNQNICSGNSTYLTVAGIGGYLTWYTAPTGGTQVSSGPYYTTPTLTSTTTYYVQSTAVCSAPNTRVAITVNVNTSATMLSTTPGSRVNPGTVVLGAVPSAGTVTWYATSTGGTSLGTGSPFTTPYIAKTTVYYAEAGGPGCTSSGRVPVLATVLGHTLAAGYLHSLVIKNDHTLWGAGENQSGQIGDGTTTNRDTLTHVGTSANWINISAGDAHSAGIQSDGSLWTWGLNTYGQLGNATTTDSHQPIQIGSSSWSNVSCGAYFTVGIKADGTLWAWGDNTLGQLGDNTTTQRTSPVQIGTATDWIGIASGTWHTVAIKSDGTLWAWGNNYYGQLGDNSTTTQLSPEQISTATTWSNIAAGTGHSLALKQDGTLWAWGYNNYGQLGNNTTTSSLVPIQIGSDSWKNVSAGVSYTAGIKIDGTLWAWGVNNNGQLGDGTTTQHNVPVQIGTENIWDEVSMDKTYGFSIGIKSDGHFCGTGYNGYGQLGNGSTTSVLSYSCSSFSSLREAASSSDNSNNVEATETSIYPNPNNGSFIIRTYHDGEYKIVNQLGQEVSHFQLNAANDYTLEVSGLANGMYAVINQTDHTQQKVLVVK